MPFGFGISFGKQPRGDDWRDERGGRGSDRDYGRRRSFSRSPEPQFRRDAKMPKSHADDEAVDIGFQDPCVGGGARWNVGARVFGIFSPSIGGFADTCQKTHSAEAMRLNVSSFLATVGDTEPATGV